MFGLCPLTNSLKKEEDVSKSAVSVFRQRST